MVIIIQRGFKNWKMAEENLDDTSFDGVLMQVIQKNRGIDGFFNCMYGFLRRKTDFFSNQSLAEKHIVQGCQKHFKLYKKESEAKAQKQKEREEKKRKKAEEREKKKAP